MLGGLTYLVKLYHATIVCGAVTLLLDALRYDRRGVSNGAALGPGKVAFARERFAFPVSTPRVIPVLPGGREHATGNEAVGYAVPAGKIVPDDPEVIARPS